MRIRASLLLFLLSRGAAVPEEVVSRGEERGLVHLHTDDEFEFKVLSHPDCWAVLFTSATRADEIAPMVRALEEAGEMLGDIVLGVADVDKLKAASSEFNVRKRMVPRLLAFKSRARMADVFKLKDEKHSADALAKQLEAEFAENPREDHRCKKATLAIGGTEEL